jgi:hypothetical protein
MNVTFRTDASLTIGHGHVMRCLALAETLREQGARVSFVCREDDGHLCDRIEQRGFIVCRLSVSKPGTQVGDIPTFSTELEYPWKEDVELTSAALDSLGEKPDWRGSLRLGYTLGNRTSSIRTAGNGYRRSGKSDPQLRCFG